jgi:diguanylate cyclase (GGDEF)-like protein
MAEIRAHAFTQPSQAPSSAPAWESWITPIRAVLLATSIPASYLGIIRPLVGAGVVVLLGGYVLLLAVGPRRVPALRRPDVVVVLDLLVITALVALSGTLKSPFLYLYYLVILEAGVRLSLFQALFTAVATAAAVILLGLYGSAPGALRASGFHLGRFAAGGFLLALILGIAAEVRRAGGDRLQWRLLLDRQFRDATGRLQAQIDKLDRLAQADSLTGLANHRALWEELEREIARAGRFRHPVSLVVADIDKFKQVNDRHGRLQGDATLRTIGEAMKKVCRTMDLGARFGGDEFVLLLPQTPKIAAVQVAERLRRQVEELSFPEGLRLTVSVGVASMPEDATTTDALLEAAELAMYQVKHSGGNRVGLR